MKKLNPFVYLFTMGHFAADWCQGAIPALLPYFIAVCNLSYQDAATLIFANMLLSSVSQPLFGYYSDKISKPWFIPVGTMMCGVCLTIIAFTTNYWTIFVCAMFSGLGSSIFHPEAALMVNRISGKLKGQALGSFSVGGNAGFAVGPMVAGFCAYAFDIRGLVIFGLVNTVLSAILYVNMPKVLKMAADAEIKDTMAHKNEAKENDWGAFSKLTVVIFARSVGFTICNTFIPIYWITVLHETPANGSLALSILFAMGACITFLGGIMADRFGFIRIMRSSFLLMIPAMFFFTNSTNVWLSTLLLIPVAFSLFAPYSPIVVLGQTYLSKNVGLASGVTLGLSTTMGGLISPLVGWGADQWGVSAALQILWVVAVFGAIFAFLAPRPKNIN
ncbi:MFS transporter [Megasphaera paucivorans]|uniref:MFS transporter, FSR family, fosmidomycin resistance protein n=1 Tax=Megasphaera paucivorans TaxID=349095 RepID=A0A1G9UW42_9FIRM|nr:MFS transporter [Megasphaera paucivorans]SDM63987.1 MFS transporter, FSR family, fosmidomycin resistance protein [Megasphaera paucivorans]